MARKDVSDALVLQAFVEAKAGGWEKYPYELLQERTGQPFKVCYAAIIRACDRDLVEYGVSLRTGWLTDKGKALLATPSPKAEERL